MRRLVVGMLLALALQPASAAAAPWRGGGAPPSIYLGDLVAESDGTLVATGGFTISIAASSGEGRPFVPPPASGLGDSLVGGLLVVNGGLRAQADGHLYASSDHGASWTLLGDLGDLYNFEGRPDVGAWAVDPAQPDNVVRLHSDGAVQRSTDGGANWVSAFPLPQPAFEFGADTAAFVDGILYVAGNGKLTRSADLAESWQALPDGPSGTLVTGPSASGVLWMAGEAGTYRSDDAAATWHLRRGPAPETPTSTLPTVVPSPDDPAVAWYVDDRSILLTDDGGVTWSALAGVPAPRRFGTALTALPGQPKSACVAASGRFWCSRGGGPFQVDVARMAGGRQGMTGFAVDPVVAGRAVAVAGSIAWETTDGSRTWHLLGAPAEPYGSVVVTAAGTFLAGPRRVLWRSRKSADWHAKPGPHGPALLAADPRTGRLYAGTPNGLWRSTSSGAFRRVRAVGLRESTGVPLSIGGGGRTVVAVAAAELAISTDAGGTFRRLKVRGRKVFAAVASPGDPGQVVALTRRGLFRSADGGTTWQQSTRHLAIPVPDPSRRGRWFAIWSGTIHVSTDGARSWHTSATPPTAANLVCCSLAVSPHRLWWVVGNGPIAAHAAVYTRSLRG